MPRLTSLSHGLKDHRATLLGELKSLTSKEIDYALQGVPQALNSATDRCRQPLGCGRNGLPNMLTNNIGDAVYEGDVALVLKQLEEKDD